MFDRADIPTLAMAAFLASAVLAVILFGLGVICRNDQCHVPRTDQEDDG